MNIMVLDTETTGLDKPFCYNIGYLIADTETGVVHETRSYVVEQIWHNDPLFHTAYYADKRPYYVAEMRKHNTTMDKYGYIMRQISRDVKKYEVTAVYAYNADFDDKVITFNCDYFHCMNPFDDVPFYDIWAYATNFITNCSEYKKMCEANEWFTETGNYKQSAETVYRFITGNIDFEESHTALDDASVETSILFRCVTLGAEWNKEYPLNKILPRNCAKPLVVKVNDEIVWQGEMFKKYQRKDTLFIKAKE